MTTITCMLRGVNVGGHNIMKMDALRDLCGSLGLSDSQTCLQSGNVVFRTRERNLLSLARDMEGAIERKFGFRSDVILRTTEELKEVIAGNPFSGRDDIDAGRLLVFFLQNAPSQETQDAILRIRAGPEEIRTANRELYVYFPYGQGKSKLMPVLGKALKTPWTGRNWNTVTKLLEIAASM